MVESFITEHRFETAAEFLTALRPSHELWRPNAGLWLYRGHADSNWLLLPSGNRRSALGDYYPTKYRGEGLYCQPDPGDLGALMAQFVYRLDAAGMSVPGRFGIEELAEKLRGDQPNADTDEIIALAQHNGLPTCFLDWTRHSVFAAYFAGSEAVRLTTDLTGDLEIWALNWKVVREGPGEVGDGTIGDTVVRLAMSTPARGVNQNLRAQGGVFTFARYDGRNGAVHTADEIVLAMVRGKALMERPAMRRLKLPQREAARLMHLLADEPVSGTTMFPGITGVVREVRDMWRYWNPD